MPIVVGISLRTAGKVYYFDPGSEHYYISERVLVETTRGMELGYIKFPPREVSDEEIVPPLKAIIRRATPDDITRDAANREREDHALQACKRHVAHLKLPMRLIDAQYTFDGGHLLIHFLADNRVDFRELVRDLARELHTRIELRQVGVRDEAKLIGGFGVCGRTLCCASFLSNFAPVAINMAKVQGLALNPQKISGTCGRLMCCLAFEYEHYREMHADLPRLHAQVQTPKGPGKITKINILSRQIEVMLPDMQNPVWFASDEVVPQSRVEGCCAANGVCPAANGADDVCAHLEGLEFQQELLSLDEADTAAPASAAPSDAVPGKRGRARRRRKKAPSAAPETAAAAPSPESSEAKTDRRPRRRRKPVRAEGELAPVGAAVPATKPDAQGAPPSSGGGRRRGRRRR